MAELTKMERTDAELQFVMRANCDGSNYQEVVEAFNNALKLTLFSLESKISNLENILSGRCDHLFAPDKEFSGVQKENLPN